jgi:diguanylate cyclase (GGDEF)-like protein
VLPVTSAGVTLISPGLAPRYIAASDDAALRFERLQTDIGQGPCIVAYETGEAVSIPDLTSAANFPLFAPAAVAAGLAAVFTLPLRDTNGRLGALDLYCDTPGELGPLDLDAAQTLADVVAAYPANAHARDEARATAERYRHGALHDPLTGLPNRLLLQQRLEHAARRAQRSGADAAILFLDLDRFKRVNDTYGHTIGDELLVSVARRLGRVVRPGDTLARFAGDEFVFLCEDLHGPEDADALARRVTDSFAETFVLTVAEIRVTASVGVAFAGPGAEISDRLLAEADIAMYQAKRKGSKNHQIIDLREQLRAIDRHRLEADLREAYAQGELDVAYQPIVRSTDGAVRGSRRCCGGGTRLAVRSPPSPSWASPSSRT